MPDGPTPAVWRLPLAPPLAAGLGLLGTLASIGGAQADAAVHAGTSKVLTGRLSDLPVITHEIASGRRISPIGTLADHSQLCHRRDPVQEARLRALKRRHPRTERHRLSRRRPAAPRGGAGLPQDRAAEVAGAGVLRIARQDFFHGLATGPDGRIYAAGRAMVCLQLSARGGTPARLGRSIHDV